MTSFVFEGPAVGGPANGRVLVSYSEVFATLYPVTIDQTNVHYVGANWLQAGFGVFRYRVQTYGTHCFFLPLEQSLEQFLTHWQPPIEQSHWPAFLRLAIEAMNKG